jgi:uncharacterized protein YeeX (DUF496 family)
VVSINNAYIKTSSNDLAASRGTTKANQASTDATSAVSSTSDDDRDPVVQIDISKLSDLLTRAKALDALQSNDGSTNVLSDQIKSGNTALNALDQSRKNTAAERQKDAEEKLQAAQKRLQLLQLLGDPKALAQDAKQISKDIKDAAKQYTTAIKDQALGTATAAPANASIPGVDSAALDGSATGAAPMAASDNVQAPTVTNASVSAASPIDGATPARAPAVPADVAASTPATPAAKAAAYAMAQHDREALARFEQAAHDVKNVAKSAAQQLKAKNPSDPDAKAADHNIKEMDKAVQALADTVHLKENGSDISEPTDSSAAGAGSYGVDILA